MDLHKIHCNYRLSCCSLPRPFISSKSKVHVHAPYMDRPHHHRCRSAITWPRATFSLYLNCQSSLSLPRYRRAIFGWCARPFRSTRDRRRECSTNAPAYQRIIAAAVRAGIRFWKERRRIYDEKRHRKRVVGAGYRYYNFIKKYSSLIRNAANFSL